MVDVIDVFDAMDIVDVTIRCVLVVVPRQTRGYIFPRQRGYDDSPAETEQLITVQFEVRAPAPERCGSRHRRKRPWRLICWITDHRVSRV